MALEYNLSSVENDEKAFEGSCEQAVDCEINLPDYCPDILRVLKCTVAPCVVSSKISGDRACADGNAHIRIVYCDEDDNLCSVEHSIPFSKYVETGSDIDGALFVFAKAEYVNCRAVSRRKAEVHGTLRFAFKILKLNKKEFVSSVETAGIQTKGGSVDFCSVTACDCKQFPISETAELPRDYLPAQRIINTSAVPILNEAKIIKGKLLVKGEIAVNVIYCADKNKGECINFDYSIPVNQVLDVHGVSEDGFADVLLRITSCDISAREDSDGEQRLFEINLVAAALVKAYVRTQADYISDAYSTAGGLDAEYENIEFFSHSQTVNDSFTCTNTFDFSSVSAQKIQTMWFGAPEIKISDGISEVIKGKAPVNFILSDSDGKSVFCEREFDFEYKIRGGGTFLNAPGIALCGFSPAALNAGKTEIRAELAVSANIFTKESRRIMTSANIKEDESDTCAGAGVVIYFPDENENLWDIARKYGTTEQAIQKENGITGEDVSVNAPLIVPCS